MVSDVLIKEGKFIFIIDFVVLDTENMPNAESCIPMILGPLFLATSNTLIKCRNGMMKPPLGSMTLDVKAFNLQRPLDGFNVVEHSSFIWVADFSYDKLEFENVDEFSI